MFYLYKIFIFPIESLLSFCLVELYSLTGDYGTSLILLSLITNIILIPVYHLADKWQEAEKHIQDRMSGEINSIKKYYTTGEKKYYQIKAVYRRYGYNPLYSLRVSLGFLIQIPFFFAAYHLLSNYQSLSGASFLFIKDLGLPDQFLYRLNILPVIMTLINIASVMIYAKNLTRTQKVQLHSLAILFLIVLYSVPAGLVLFWTTNNIISLIKNAVKVIKTQRWSEFKSKFTTANLHNFFNQLLVNQNTRYLVYGMLFIVSCLMTFHSLNENNYGDALAKMSIRSSVFLLFATAALVASGLTKQWAKSFRGFLLVYLVILLTTSIVPVLLSINLKASGIITSSSKFILFYELITVIIFLFCFQRVLLKEHGINIMEPFHSLSNYDKKNFTLALFLFHIIFFIWGTTLTVHSAAPDEFFIGFIDILLWQLFFFLVSFVVFSVFYLLVPRLIKYLLTFVMQYLSVTAIIYLIFNRKDVGLMDHFAIKEEHWLEMGSHELFLEVVLLYFILLVLYLSLRHASRIMNRIMVFVIIVISLSSIYYSGKIFQSQIKEVAANNKFELALAKDKSNVLIFLLDAFSGGAIKRLEDNNPELLSSLDGFTWYKNVLTASAGTYGSIATLYGGHKYSIKEINKNSLNYLREDFYEAYNFLNRQFAQRGYLTKHVNPPLVTCNDIDNNAECYRIGSRSNETNNSLGLGGIKNKTGTSAKYTIPLLVSAVTTFKSIPHMFQEYIYDSGAWHGIVEKRILFDGYNKKSQWNFLLSLKDSVKVVNKPTFNFIYLFIPHAANIMNSQCAFGNIHSKSNYFNDTYCSINAIRQLIPRMKELEVYDNTMIVLISDHGAYIENKLFNEEVFSRKVHGGYQNRLSPGLIHPLLMVKDINSRGNFDFSEVFLSNSDLPSIVCTVIGSCEGIPSDYRKYKGKRVLTIDVYAPENEIQFLSRRGYGLVRERYEVTDNIFDVSNWKKVF